MDDDDGLGLLQDFAVDLGQFTTYDPILERRRLPDPDGDSHSSSGDDFAECLSRLNCSVGGELSVHNSAFLSAATSVAGGKNGDGQAEAGTQAIAALEECKNAIALETGSDIASTLNGATNSRFGLPPCKVCGAKGTGFHYGVNTCEACKGFFRRSLIRKEAYVCRKSTKCELLPGKRNMCAFCRLKKCLDAGMSVGGIKTGRYTYEKRRKDTVEVRLMQAEEALASAQRHEEDRQEQIEQLIKIVVDARRRHYKDSEQDDDQLATLQKDFIMKKHSESFKESALALLDSEQKFRDLDEFFGTDESKLSKEDKCQAFQHWLTMLENGIKCVINFAKALPGFKQLDMNDQISLFKNSMCEVWLITRHRAINPDYKCFTTTSGDTFDVLQCYGDEYGEAVLRVSRRLRALDLTYDENAVLSAYLIFCSDRFELDLCHPERVAELQDKFLEALQWMLRKNHADKLTFARLTAVLTEMRSVTELYHKHNEEIFIKNFQRGMLQVPPLFWELVSPT